MSNTKIETCPVCGVKIENGDKVIFATGKPGSRGRLYARVCNFVKNADCINQDEARIGAISSNDYYRPI